MEVGAILGQTPQRVLAAIVFTDAVDFSARIGENEERTVELIREDIEVMRNLCAEFDGQVVKSRGDGLMMLFTSAVQAVSCAVEIQKCFADRLKTNPKDDRLTHRIGIHLGDVLMSDGDALGDGVNVAARLEEESEPGGICMSQTVYDVVKNRLFLQATKLGELKLRNIAEPVQAYKVAGVGRARRHHYARPHWTSLAVAGLLLLLVGVGGTAWYYKGKIADAQKPDYVPAARNNEFPNQSDFNIPIPPIAIGPNDKNSQDDRVQSDKNTEKWAEDWKKWGEQWQKIGQDAAKSRSKAMLESVRQGSPHAGHPNIHVDLPQPPAVPTAPPADSLGG